MSNSGARRRRVLTACGIAGTIPLILTALASGTASAVSVKTTIKVGTQPISAVFSPNGDLAYVVSIAGGKTGNGGVSVVNTKTDKVLRTLTAGDAPFQAALSPDGTTLALANQGGGGVTLVNTKSGVALPTIPLSVGATPVVQTAGVTYSPNGKDLYALSLTSSGGVVDEINTSTLKVVHDFLVNTFEPLRAVFSPNGKTLYLVSSEFTSSDGDRGQLTALNPTTLVPQKEVSLPEASYGFAVSPNGQSIYVADFQEGTGITSGGITEVNAAKFKVTRTVHLGIVPVGLALSPNGRALYVPSSFSIGRTEVFNAANLTALRTVGAITGSLFPSFSPSGQQMFIPKYFTSAGTPTGNTVTVLNTSLTQAGAKSATVRQHKSFAAALHTSGPSVDYVTTKAVKGLTVSSSGVVRGASSLTPGTHTVKGTTSDADGDSGTWTFTLKVTKA